MNIDQFERYDFAKENMIPLLMKSFDRRYLFLVSKNFLRFGKGKGFKEISYTGKVLGIEDTYSEFFLKRIRAQLLIPGDKITKDFMNTFFNTLNELTTELFVTFKELKNNSQ